MTHLNLKLTNSYRITYSDYNPKNIQKEKPNYILILPWNLRKEVSLQLKIVKKWKCKFVTFIPKLKIF